MQPEMDEINSAGVAAVLAGSIEQQEPPRDDGRWGLSILLLPAEPLSDRLEALTQEVLEVAGPSHWSTAGGGGAHLTVRALETYRSPERRDLDAESRYLDALRRVTADLPSPRFAFRGVFLSPGAVLLGAIDLDGTAGALRTRLAHELSEDLESHWRRSPFWYLSLVHFAGEVADPGRLLAWVSDRSELDLGTATFSEAHQCRFDFDGRRALPRSLGSVRLGVGAPVEVAPAEGP
ncbi:MAG: hypothetical protein ACYCTI_01855 [Acidimicrobiales bacterium]